MFTLLMLLACSNPDAVRQCNAMLLAVCDNLEAACEEDGCWTELHARVDCEDAVDVDDSYDTCMAELAAEGACLADVGVPTACENAVILKR